MAISIRQFFLLHSFFFLFSLSLFLSPIIYSITSHQRVCHKPLPQTVNLLTFERYVFLLSLHAHTDRHPCCILPSFPTDFGWITPNTQMCRIAQALQHLLSTAVHFLSHLYQISRMLCSPFTTIKKTHTTMSNHVHTAFFIS